MGIEVDTVAIELMLLIADDARNPSSMFVNVGKIGDTNNQFEIITADRRKFRIAVARILEGDNDA